MTLASQTPGIPLTHVVRMGMDPAAAPKSPFPSRAQLMGLKAELEAIKQRTSQQ